ncbi:hypothetical protein [Chryseobacterium sp. Marseille-Q3244]|uniref:hypothetical protein n=1 Tax=Chryseobacterium sp. Marseille-Q3244 TaxID=2758092 RepID=UPI002024F082|nr:hypothetical protein [Chryseobacterium sp. Marseille-Q3244]
MLENLNLEIENLIEEQGRDLKFKLKDTVLPSNFDCTISISYDYLLTDTSEYSFSNPEFNKVSSEKHPNMSDAHIYFSYIKKICNSKFSKIVDDKSFFQIVNPNKNLKEIADFIFSEPLQAEQIPQFFEIRLYTNKDKAPRIFGFIGHTNIFYILFYDPFHKIFNKTGKI